MKATDIGEESNSAKPICTIDDEDAKTLKAVKAVGLNMIELAQQRQNEASLLQAAGYLVDEYSDRLLLTILRDKFDLDITDKNYIMNQINQIYLEEGE